MRLEGHMKATVDSQWKFQHWIVYTVYGVIDKANRIDENLCEDNGPVIFSIKSLNQLGGTAPIKSPQNIIETLKSDRPE